MVNFPDLLMISRKSFARFSISMVAPSMKAKYWAGLISCSTSFHAFAVTSGGNLSVYWNGLAGRSG